MRVVAELIGIFLILVGAYYGGRDIWDRWVNGPKKRDQQVAYDATREAQRQANETKEVKGS